MTTTMFSSMAQIAGTSSHKKSSSEIDARKEVSFSHVVTISGYLHSLNVAPQEYLRSCFTAAGHRWSVLYYPRGNVVHEDAKYISLYLHCTDDDGTDVKARAKLRLLDRDGKVAYTRDTPFYSRMCGFPKFINRRELESSGHVHDDRFSVQFDVTVLKPAVVIPAKEDTGAVVQKFVDMPPTDIFQRLGELLSSGDGADVVFEVDGESFGAHRSVLAARSPVFRAELFSPMKEGTATCVWVKDMEPRVFKALLHFVYNDELPPLLLPEIDDDEGGEAAMVMVQHMLVAADRYCLERMKLMCEQKLFGFIDSDTVGNLLELADQHGCRGLQKACLSFLKSDGNLLAAVVSGGLGNVMNSCPAVKELLLEIARSHWSVTSLT